MRASIVLGALLALAAITSLSCSDGFPPEFPVAEFTLKSPLTKTEVTLATIKGRPAIIYWFTSW